MNKIQNLSLHNLRNNEHYQFMTDVDVLIAKLLPAELGVADLYTSFKNTLVAEDKAMRIEQGSSKSYAINVCDDQRDNTWNAINYLAKAMALSPIDAEVQSTLIIRRIIDLYGDPRNLSYNEESAAITNLVSDLQSPVNAPHVEKIRMTAWVTELKKLNDKFKTLFNERNTEYSGRESGDVRAVRKQIDPLYEQITDRINASVIMKVAKPAATTFINELNEKIKYYKNNLSNRNGRKGDKDS